MTFELTPAIERPAEEVIPSHWKIQNPAVVALVRKVQEILRTEPETYNQESYCGSACCVAGHLVRQHPDFTGMLQPYFPSGFSNGTWLDRFGEQRSVGDEAARMLGFEFKELFRGPSARPDFKPWEDERTHLFTGDPTEGWPSPFNEEWAAIDADEDRLPSWHYAALQRRRADVAIRRLDYFLEQGH